MHERNHTGPHSKQMARSWSNTEMSQSEGGVSHHSQSEQQDRNLLIPSQRLC